MGSGVGISSDRVLMHHDNIVSAFWFACEDACCERVYQDTGRTRSVTVTPVLKLSLPSSHVTVWVFVPTKSINSSMRIKQSQRSRARSGPCNAVVPTA